MQRAEPGEDLLTGAGQALLAPRPDPVRGPPVLSRSVIIVSCNDISCYDAKSATIWPHAQAERPPIGGALC